MPYISRIWVHDKLVTQFRGDYIPRVFIFYGYVFIFKSSVLPYLTVTVVTILPLSLMSKWYRPPVPLLILPPAICQCLHGAYRPPTAAHISNPMK